MSKSKKRKKSGSRSHSRSGSKTRSPQGRKRAASGFLFNPSIIILCLIVLPPVGLTTMWMSRTFSKNTRIIVTVAVVLFYGYFILAAAGVVPRPSF